MAYTLVLGKLGTLFSSFSVWVDIDLPHTLKLCFHWKLFVHNKLHEFYFINSTFFQANLILAVRFPDTLRAVSVST